MSSREGVLDAVRDWVTTQPKKEFSPGETYLPPSGKMLDADDIVNVVDAALDGWLTAGRFTKEFETNLAKVLGLRSAAMVSSGSSANLAAFAALTSKQMGERRIAPGTEVITVAAGFPTTVAPIVQFGAVPVFVDIDLATHNIDASLLEGALSSDTRAVVLAHTLGNPFDLERVSDFCKKHDLFLLEDCCDALGARYAGRSVGSFGDLATLSFYPAHHITTGEGGAVLGSPSLIKIVESFRDWGRDCWCQTGCDNTCGKRFEWQLGSLPAGYDHKYVYSELGFNLKATDLQAALGASQLRKLEHFVAKRRANHAFLVNAFQSAGLDQVFDLPQATHGSEPSWFGFVLTLREDSGFERSEVARFLESKRIGSRPVFAGNLLRQPAFDGVRHRVASSLEHTDAAMFRSFWIGVWPGLGESELGYIVESFTELVRTNAGRKRSLL